MNEGKVYETHKVEKVNVDGTDYLRFIVFSGLDPASLYRGEPCSTCRVCYV